MLKKIIFCFLVCFFTYNTHSQDIIPNINLKTINGQTISADEAVNKDGFTICLLYTSPSPRDAHKSRMPSSA